MMRIAVLLVFLGSLGARVVTAQKVIAPSAATLADSVARLGVDVLPVLYRAAPPVSADALEHLHHGLVAKRLYEQGPVEAVREAAQRSFDRAKDLQPELSWAHYGYGWALARAGELRIPLPGLRRIVVLASLTEVVGLDAISRAQRALRHALELEPALEPAAAELARIALATRSANDAAEAAAAIRGVLQRRGGAEAATYLVMSELQLMRGELDSAADAARVAVELEPTAAAVRVLALTLLTQAEQRDRGVAEYLRGLELGMADSGIAGAYEADITPVVIPGELEEWRALAPEARVAWLLGFWERRATEAVVSLGERLAEHFRRLRVANQQYQRVQDYGSRPADALLYRPTEDLPFDDRGLVYLRYGKPDTVVTTPLGVDEMPPPNEAWVYRLRSEDPLVFNFLKLTGTTDWILGEGPRCYPFFFALGQPNADAQEPASLITKRQSLEGYTRYYEDRGFVDKRNLLLANRCREMVTGIARSVDGRGSAGMDPFPLQSRDLLHRTMEMEEEQRQRIRSAMLSEDARPDYDRPLPILTSVYTFRGDSGTDVTAALLVPGGQFTPTHTDEGALYPLRLSLVLHDSTTGRARTSHEVQRFGSPEVLRQGRYFRVLLHTASAPFPRGDVRLRIENEGTSSEGQVQAGPQVVRDYGGNALLLSDLVVAEPEGGRWRRGETTLSPIPSHQVETGRTFRLFYEIYNLAPNAPYRTSVQVQPAAASGLFDRIRSLFGKDRTIELSFDDAAATADPRYGVQEVRSVMANLPPGSYTMKVMVTHLGSGATAERTAPLSVIPVQRR